MGKTIVRVLGVVFVAIGILGFFTPTILGLFEVDAAHNLVHIVLGLVLLLAPTAGATLTVGVVYLVVAVLGFAMGPGKLLGLVHVNGADNWLHLVLAAVLIAASRCSSMKSGAMPAMPPAAPMA